MSRTSPLGIARAAVIFGALIAFPFAFPQPWLVNMAFFVLMYAGLAQAWNVLGGYSGYVSLGHAAFFGLGAYAEAILFSHIDIGSPGYVPFFVLPAIGIGIALASVPVAWVALRTRALTFAIVTLTLLFVVQTLAFNLHWLTNGSQGLSVPSPSFFPYERPFYLCVLGIFALATLISWHVRRDTLGLTLLAIRDDEDRATGLGAHVTLAKVIAFVISVGLTAMVGGVWAYYIGFVYPQFAIDPLVTIGTVLAVFLGGTGTVWGPALGAFILVPAQQWLAYEYGTSQVYLVAYAAVFLVIILLLPQGILPSLQDLRRRRTGGRTSGRAEPVSAAAPVGSPST